MRAEVEREILILRRPDGQDAPADTIVGLEQPDPVWFDAGGQQPPCCIEPSHAGADDGDVDIALAPRRVGRGQAALFFASRALMLSTSALGVAANSVFV
jgi:hypothetical protein